MKNTIKYTRRFELEGENNHLLIIDVENGIKTKKRLINIYRSFNSVGLSERDLFTRQLDLIKLAFNNDSALIGDLNLDYKKRYDVNYQRRSLFDLFEDKLGGLNLIQLVKFVILNGRIPLDWFNMTINTYKVHCKKRVFKLMIT